MANKEKVLLAYSGGLDTSCILAWLIEQGHEVVCFLADVGQAEDFKEAERKAVSIGAKKFVVEDLKREFVEDLCFRAIQCNPSINVIAPWRLPEFYNRFAGRNDLLDYAAKRNIPVTSTKAKPWSMDENLAHCSYEAGILEEADVTPPDDMWKLTDDPRNAPNTPEDVTIFFEKGLPVGVVLGSDPKAGNKMSGSLELFTVLNELGRKHAMSKWRDSPAMTILRLAHLDLEGLVLDREVRLLRDQFVTITWSKLLYNGLYFSPERKFIEKSIIASQDDVNGQVRLRCYKGSVSVLGRSSETSKLYSPEQSSMDSLEDFQPTDTTGFIATQAIRLKAYGNAEAAAGIDLSES
ncbi:argininosuccinate synthetase [Emydomyces testavorans]|uniref:argininosuccinate synthase n=1 Tax=Emydomyces testavorans TaxID=2070801 RepID=A0AAF0IFS0_9EURO|nr:argininosuccinate synthetase [Emydomyces testavorans]